MDVIRLIILLVLLISLVIPASIIFIVVRGNDKKTFENIKLEERKNSIFKYVKGTDFSEIIIIYRYFSKIKGIVYSDINTDTINDEDFSFINEFRVKKMFKVAEIIKNGSRFWVVDEIKEIYDGKIENILSFNMNQFSIVKTHKDTVSNRTTYNKLNLEIKMGYKLLKGSKKFELITAENESFIMISGSRSVDSQIDMSNLEEYLKKVYLPKGWTLKISEVEEDIIYNVDGMTAIVEDEYQNIYLLNK